MLQKQGILTKDEKDAIVKGLTGFIDDVDGLVGQEAVGDKLSARCHCIFNGGGIVFHMMILLVDGLQTL